MTSTHVLRTMAALTLLVAACLPGDNESATTSALASTADTSPAGTDANSASTSIGGIRSSENVECDPAPEEVAIVCEAYDLIQVNYVDDVSDETLVEAAIQGLQGFSGTGSSEPVVCPLPSEAFAAMCEAAADTELTSAEAAEAIVNGFALFGLDPNSAYLDEEALELLQEEQEGEIEGIGALVSPEDETIEGEDKQCALISDTCRLVVASTIEGTPADQAGLEAGDVIAAVDGEDIRGWTVDEVTALVRGPAGSDVRLTIERGSDTFDVTITRASVTIPVIETDQFGDDGYIRLRVFSGNADEQFEAAVIQLLGEGVDDLVVDLRNNPGGLLDTAIEITSVFLGTGDVVVTEGPNSDITYPVSGSSLVPEDVDVVFVVNRGSASASEVVSAVLQERSRATVVGETTFGKNTVQQQFGLSNGGALKLTIARWLTPDGLDFGGAGVMPDIPMTFDQTIAPEELVASVVELG